MPDKYRTIRIERDRHSEPNQLADGLNAQSKEGYVPILFSTHAFGSPEQTNTLVVHTVILEYRGMEDPLIEPEKSATQASGYARSSIGRS